MHLCEAHSLAAADAAWAGISGASNLRSLQYQQAVGIAKSWHSFSFRWKYMQLRISCLSSRCWCWRLLRDIRQRRARAACSLGLVHGRADFSTSARSKSSEEAFNIPVCLQGWVVPPALSFGCEGYRNSGRVGSGLRRVGSGWLRKGFRSCASGQPEVSGPRVLELWVTSGCEVDPDSWSSKSFWL